MFRDFASFANRVNQKLQCGGWRLQEEPRGEGTRNYTILYNGLEVGRLKLDTWGLKYATADSEISATVQLNYLQLFTHSTVYHFLDCLAYFLGSDTRANFDRQKAHIDHDLAAHLWNVVRVPGTLQPFSMHITRVSIEVRWRRMTDVFGKAFEARPRRPASSLRSYLIFRQGQLWDRSQRSLDASIGMLVGEKFRSEMQAGSR